MDSSESRFDRNLFNNEVLTRAAHRYSGSFYVSLRSEGPDTIITLIPFAGTEVPHDLVGRLQNDVLDEQLRSLIRAETHQLHEQLITAAFREATVRQPDVKL